jgi:hypothetical protein
MAHLNMETPHGFLTRHGLLTHLSWGQKAISSKWILKVKLNVVGNVNYKYRARLAAKDFPQVVGID